MTTTFPATIDSFSTKTDNVTEVLAAHVNNLQDSVVSTQAIVQPVRDISPLINPVPVVWQRGVSFAAMADGARVADMWTYQKTGVMVHTCTQDTTIPTVAQAGVKVPYSIKLDVTTVDAAIANGDYCVLTTRIEGYNFLHLAQRIFTIGFWVRDTKTGIHCVSFTNSARDRSYVAEYTVNVADTFEYKTITVAASPTAGTWDYTTGIGLSIRFALAAGVDFQTTASSWQTGDFMATANQVNAADSTANNFYITGLTIYPGAYAKPIIIPDYQQELGRCLRYAYVLDASSDAADMGFGTRVGGVSIAINFQYPVPMRAAPALVHNISGYTAGAPTTTTIGIINYNTGAFYTITGALTVAITSPNKIYSAIGFTAGTSWSGTTGDIATLRIGPTVVAVFGADL